MMPAGIRGPAGAGLPGHPTRIGMADGMPPSGMRRPDTREGRLCPSR
jgi:hypothetical protein